MGCGGAEWWICQTEGKERTVRGSGWERVGEKGSDVVFATAEGGGVGGC